MIKPFLYSLAPLLLFTGISFADIEQIQDAQKQQCANQELSSCLNSCNGPHVSSNCTQECQETANAKCGVTTRDEDPIFDTSEED